MRENVRRFMNAGIYGKIRAKPKKSAEPETAADRFALLAATCGGVGYLPLVPATWGSLAGVGLYVLASKAGELVKIQAGASGFPEAFIDRLLGSATILFIIALFFTGVRTAKRVEKMTGQKDPSIVVIDEVVGQIITFLFVPARLGVWGLAAGFLAFRFFDIYKPYPTARFEVLPDGLGAMSDDVMAGFYAAALLSILYAIYPAL
jgi:phosphatidylglycerophosphatase A